jgi:hypothetical protein
VLDRQLRLLPEAASEGTEYIQTKALCLQQLEKHPLADRIVALFPTLVFGGRVDGRGPFPTSYLTAGLVEASRWRWLAKWLRVDASFHFIHAADIARVCLHLLSTPQGPNPEPGQGQVRRLVLGQPAVSVNRTVRQLMHWCGGWMPPAAAVGGHRLGPLLDSPAPFCARADQPAGALRAGQPCPHAGGGIRRCRLAAAAGAGAADVANVSKLSSLQHLVAPSN